MSMKERKENSLKKKIIKIIEAALGIFVGVMLASFIIGYLCLHWNLKKEIWFLIIISFIIFLYNIAKKRIQSLIYIISACLTMIIVWTAASFSIWLNEFNWFKQYGDIISYIIGALIMLSTCFLIIPKEDSKIRRMLKILGCFAAYIIFVLILIFVFKTFQ